MTEVDNHTVLAPDNWLSEKGKYSKVKHIRPVITLNVACECFNEKGDYICHAMVEKDVEMENFPFKVAEGYVEFTDDEEKQQFVDKYLSKK